MRNEGELTTRYSLLERLVRTQERAKTAELAGCKTLENKASSVDAALLSSSVRRRRTVSRISHEPSYSHQFER